MTGISRAEAYHDLATVEINRKNWTKAEEYLTLALGMYITSGDVYNQADVLRHLGIVTHQQRQWDQASDYFIRAMKIYTDHGDIEKVGLVFVDMVKMNNEKLAGNKP
jgi:tetratricopeptide (TPR) repeat protein